MIRFCLIFVLFIALFTGCSPIHKEKIELEDVFNAFREHELTLALSNRDMPITFNGVKSDAFCINEEWIYIFIYDSAEGRVKGVSDYKEVRKKVSGWLPGTTYEVDNIFVLYLKENEDLSERIMTVIKSLSSNTQ